MPVVITTQYFQRVGYLTSRLYIWKIGLNAYEEIQVLVNIIGHSVVATYLLDSRQVLFAKKCEAFTVTK